jgi:hypothetical protein
MKIFLLFLVGAMLASPYSVMAEDPDGANVTVDGILKRTEYQYSPPQAFFDAPDGDTNLTGPDIYQVENFGAVADPSVDNRIAIQNAINAANRNGGGVVVLKSGTYGVGIRPANATTSEGGILLKNNVFLKGQGMDKSVLRVFDGWESSRKLTGIVRTPWGEATKNVGVSDLTLDGNRENTNGVVDGYFSGGIPGTDISDQDAWVFRVEIRNCEGYGFDPHERTVRLSITDCIAHHNGKDGFVADFCIDGEFKNNVSYENDRHGFNIVTSTNDFLLSDNIARDNGGGGFVVQRGSYDIPLPNNILIEGGESFGNDKEGVLIKMSYNVEIREVYIHDNGTYGVRLYGASNVSVLNNRIIDNSRAKDGSYPAIQIKDYEGDEASGRTYYAESNLISDNDIDWSDGLSGKGEVQVDAENEDWAPSAAREKTFCVAVVGICLDLVTVLLSFL